MVSINVLFQSISPIVDESNKLCSPPSPTDKECDVEQLQLESEELLVCHLNLGNFCVAFSREFYSDLPNFLPSIS